MCEMAIVVIYFLFAPSAGVPGVGEQCENSSERTSETPETDEEDWEKRERSLSDFTRCGLLIDRLDICTYLFVHWHSLD